jgi:hypothetical protein
MKKIIAIIVLALAATYLMFYALKQNPIAQKPESQKDPAMTVQELTYRNAEFRFSVEYPEGFTENMDAGYQFSTKNSLIRFNVPQKSLEGSNLGEAAVIIGASKENAIVNECLATSSEIENEKRLDEKKILSGADFSIFQGLGAAAGNRYDTTDYRTIKDKVCYEITLLLHYGDIHNYPEGTVKEFDRTKILEMLGRVADTFKFE